VLTFMVDLADETQLTLDPAMDTYYFMDTVVTKMPAMLEPMGITRARGTGVLSSQELTLDHAHRHHGSAGAHEWHLARAERQPGKGHEIHAGVA
jgi:hypothetical protein